MNPLPKEILPSITPVEDAVNYKKLLIDKGIPETEIDGELLARFEAVHKSVDGKLDLAEISSQTTLAGKKESLNKILELHEKDGTKGGSVETAVAEATDTLGKKAAEAVEDATSAATEAVQSTWLGKITDIKDSILTKIAATFGLGVTTLTLMKESIKPIAWLESTWLGDSFLGKVFGLKQRTTKTAPETTEIPATIPEGEAPQDEADETDELPVTPEEAVVAEVDVAAGETNQNGVKVFPERKNLEYSAGYVLLLELSGVTFEDNVGKQDIGENLQDITYTNFLKKRNSQDFKKEIVTDPALTNQYEHISTALASKKVQDLTRIGLSSDMLKTILGGFEGKKENEKIKEALGITRFNEIKLGLENNTFSYTNLTIGELSLLYIETIPALTNGTLGLISTSFTSGIHNILGFSTEAAKRLADSSDNYFSPEFIGKVGMETGKSEDLDKSREVLITKYGITTPEELERFNELYRFKDYVLSSKFMGNEKLLLSSEHQELLKGKLNFRWLIALHSAMGGLNIEELSPINIPIVVWLNNTIMAFGRNPGDSLTAANYLATFGKKALIPSESKNIFSEDERTVIGIYRDKILDVTIMSYLKEIYGVIGLGVEKDNLLQTGIVVGAAGMATRYLGDKSTKSTLAKGKYPFFSRFITKAGWAGIAGGVLLSGLSVISSNNDVSSLDSELEEARENGDAQKVIDILEAAKNSIQTFQDLSGENIHFLSHGGQSPRVFYKNNVYEIQVISTNGSVEESGWLEFATGLAQNAFLLSRDATLGGEDISTVSIEKGKIVLGDRILEIDIQDSINSGLEKKKIGESLPGKVTLKIKELAPDIKFLDGSGVIEILSLQKIDDGKLIIGLVPLKDSEATS